MNYGIVAKKARAAIRKNGAPCKIVRQGETVYNPETDEYGAAEQVISGYAVQEAYDASMIDGTVIRAGDVKLLCSFDVEPKEGDKIEFAGKVYAVISIEPLKPDGKTAITYTIQGRA